MSPPNRIVVIGLGYVGLPLAIALALKFDTVGCDVDEGRIAELRAGHDRTGEIDSATLTRSGLKLTDNPQDCAGADVYIVTVPTSIDAEKRPDLTALLTATRMVAQAIDPGLRPTVVIESTIYPGVTENLCGPEIEHLAKLKRGRDFRLAYSPERINPGDREHRIETITKVIAGEDEEVLDQLERIYGSITEGGVFRAASIKVA
ncbi:MAG: nucleotide sugar dehydrogenase, partial [Sphingomicrobium sp.]